MPRRAQTSTPPKPASDILANAANRAIRLGGADNGGVGAGTAAGGESGGMFENLERPPRQRQPVFRVFHSLVAGSAPDGPGGPCFSQRLRPILRVPVRRLWK